MEGDEMDYGRDRHGAHHSRSPVVMVGQPQALARSPEVTAWLELCRRAVDWLDEVLEVLSPIATGALILGLLSWLWLALTS